jgi:probable F420-dependent oxidoreductase
MKLGIALPTGAPHGGPDAIRSVALAAEQLGYATVWAHERILLPCENGVAPLLELYSFAYDPLESLAWVAALTERVQLGTSVLIAPLHVPVVLARRLASLDRLSGGRVIAGLGSGWMPEEFTAAGVPFERRNARLEEFVRVLHATWGNDPVRHTGEFYQVPASRIGPKPHEAGGIPVFLGVNGPRAVARAATFADGINPLAFSLDGLRQQVRGFREAAAAAGRDIDGLRVVPRANGPITERPIDTDRPFLGGSVEQIAEDMAAVSRLGVDEILFAPRGATAEDLVRHMAALAGAAASVAAPVPW